MRFVLAVVAVFLLGGLAFAQAPVSLSADLVSEQIKKVEADPALDDVQRQKAKHLLELTAESLKAALAFDATSTELDQTLQQASATMESIRQELAAPVVAYELPAGDRDNLTALEQILAQITADADAVRQRISELDAEDKRLTARRMELPTLLATATAKRDELAESLAERSEDNGSLAVSEANRWMLNAANQEVLAQIRALEKELSGYDTYRALLTARRDRAARRAATADAKMAILRKAVDERRRIESEEAAVRAESARRAAAQHDPVIRAVAEQNVALAALRAGEDGLSVRLLQATEDFQTAKKLASTIQKRSEELQQRIDAAGLTHAMAQLLRREQDRLPYIRSYRPRIRVRKTEIATVQLALLDFGDQRGDLRDIGARVERAVDGMDADKRREAATILTEYFTVQRDQLDVLIDEYNRYFNTLVDLDAAERQVIKGVELFSDQIAEQILWVRSDPPFGFRLPQQVLAGLAWVSHLKNWRNLSGVLFADLKRYPLLPVLLLLAEAMLLSCYVISGRRLGAISARVAKIRTDRFIFTMEALVHTTVRALPVPLALFYVAWRLGASGSADEFVSAMGSACMVSAPVLFAHMVAYEAAMKKGLAESHFGWAGLILRSVRKVVSLLMLTAVPLLWLSVLLHAPAGDAELAPLGRLCFVGLHGVLMFIAYRSFGRNAKIMVQLKELDPDYPLVKFRRAALVAGVGIPGLIAVLAGTGYYYSAVQMAGWVAKTGGLVLAIAFLEALLVRGLRIVSRRAEFERRVRERQREAVVVKENIEVLQPEEQERDFAALSENTKTLLRVSFGFVLLFGMWFIWVDAVPALGVFGRIVLWKVMAEGAAVGSAAYTSISLANLFVSGVVVVVTVVACRHLPGLIELAVLRQLPIAYGERYAISTIIRYVTAAVGIGVAFSMLGVGWSKIRWLIAALSVGLGFGLQEIFANFVSGLILLFERPIRVRDYVTVNGTSGQVTRIQIRATTITDWDNKELLIPNKQFVTGELVNWTLTNSVLRVVVPVGIAYGSDTAKAESVLMKIGKNYLLSIADPSPSVYFVGFGDSSLNFELRIFIGQASQFMQARHDLHMEIDAAFRKAGIEIAFPQLDVHVKDHPFASITPGSTL
jgi:potassium efflux system protein